MNVSNNTITSNGTCTSGTLRGIYHHATGTLPTTGNYVNNYNNNVITLTSGTTSAIYGIHLDNLNAQFTTNVNGNTANNLNASVATTGSGTWCLSSRNIVESIYERNHILFNSEYFQSGAVYVIHGGSSASAKWYISRLKQTYIQLNKSGAGGTGLWVS